MGTAEGSKVCRCRWIKAARTRWPPVNCPGCCQFAAAQAEKRCLVLRREINTDDTVTLFLCNIRI